MFVAAATGGASVLRLGVAAVCGAVSWLVFAGLWVATRGGIGFGDVRFIPSLALATAAHSVTLLFAALIAWMYWRVAHVPGGQAIGALEAWFAKLGKLFGKLFGRRRRSRAMQLTPAE